MSQNISTMNTTKKSEDYYTIVYMLLFGWLISQQNNVDRLVIYIRNESSRAKAEEHIVVK